MHGVRSAVAAVHVGYQYQPWGQIRVGIRWNRWKRPSVQRSGVCSVQREVLKNGLQQAVRIIAHQL